MRGMEAISTHALLDLLGLPKTTGSGRRIAPTMRALGFIPIKSRHLMPGGYRDTVTRGWARPVREVGCRKSLKLGKKESEACHLTPQCASRLVSRRGHIMMFENGHFIVTLEEWRGFKSRHESSKMYQSHLIDELIDREKCGCFPDWFVPLAPGVMIAGDELLRQAGHHRGMHRPRGWSPFGSDYYTKVIRRYRNSPLLPDLLAVRRCDKHKWWMIERRIAEVNEVLVFDFASIPILTRNYASAMRLAMHCNVDNPQHGHWIKQAPDDCAGAIELARQRRIKEALAVNSAQPEGRLH